MAGRVRSETYGGHGVCSVIVNGFDLGEGGKMVGFGVEGGSLIGRGGEISL